MSFQLLPFGTPAASYEAQAAAVLAGHRARDHETLDAIHRSHPRFLDDEVKWLPRDLGVEEIADAPFDLDDARLTVARIYNYLDWDALTAHVTAQNESGSPTFLFERAVHAVIHGDEPALAALLAAHPDLVHARSTRRCNFDPPVHRATLLHYIAANGVEGYHQLSPPNAVAIARQLLEAGSVADALASMYGGECTTMSMLVSSTPPHQAGVQVPLVELLVDYGASPGPGGTGSWTSPLRTALVFGFRDAADALVRRGAPVDDIVAAAGLDMADAVRAALPAAGAADRHAALALAAQLGHAAVVGLLLDAGEDPNRYNPEGFHAHSTPLHQAAFAGHLEVVKLLMSRGARQDIHDTIWDGTALGWAEYGEKREVAVYLRGTGNRDRD